MKAVLTLAAALLFATSPLFSGSFGGFDPAQFPVPQVDPPIVPAGYAFAIWGLIYVYLVVHAAFGLLKRDTDPSWDTVRWPLIVSLTLGASWISVAKISPLWATVLIWMMLVTALVALFRSPLSKERWLIQVPLAVYAGWLTAASFVSLGLVGAGYDVLTNHYGWAWITLISTLVFAGVVQLRSSETPEYGLTVCWALIAIAVRNLGTSWDLSAFAIIGTIAVGLIASRFWRKSRNPKIA